MDIKKRIIEKIIFLQIHMDLGDIVDRPNNRNIIIKTLQYRQKEKN